VKDTASTLLKLEEARIVLNRLIGPGGALTPQEREKYLKKAIGAETAEAQMGPNSGPTPGGPLGNIGQSAPSNKALQGASQYAPLQ